MKRRHLIALGVATLLGVLAASAPLWAHHAFGAEFDRNAPIRLQGKIVKLEWVNPHAWIHMEVEAEDGGTEVWMVEGGTPNTLLRRGLKRDCRQSICLPDCLKMACPLASRLWANLWPMSNC